VGKKTAFKKYKGGVTKRKPRKERRSTAAGKRRRGVKARGKKEGMP